LFVSHADHHVFLFSFSPLSSFPSPKTPDQTTGGLTGADTKEACQCPKELYYTGALYLDGVYQNETKDEQGNAVCVDCPAGADCSAHNGMTVPELVALPGYWRPENLSLVFSPCSVGFQGTDEEKQTQAEQRCCPLNTTTNRSICENVTFVHPDEQCKTGFQGALCLVCADGWVPKGSECVECSNGGELYFSFLLMIGLCSVVCLVIFIILIRSVKEEKLEMTKSAFGQLKIILAYVQIMASMPGVMESVPFPKNFLSFASPFNVFIKLDVLSVFEQSSCGLSLTFPQKFVVQMFLPVMLAVASQSAYYLSNMYGNKDKVAKQHRNAQSNKILILLILFIYPSLCTGVFTMFRKWCCILFLLNTNVYFF
jgi:hypothetical protein